MSKKVDAKTLTVDQEPLFLPSKGLKCEKDILPFLPFKRSTLWAWSKSGKFPAHRRIHGITVWSCEEVWAWLVEHGCTPPLDNAA